MNQVLVFDVETPNGNNDRICSIAICLLQDGQIVRKMDSLINPETAFDPRNISIHGIAPQHVLDSPTFPQVWSQWQEFFESSIVVAHGAPLDLSALRKTLEHYSLPVPILHCADTLRISRRLIPGMPSYSLSPLCDRFGVELLQHHHAGSDASACANVLLAMLREYQFDLADFVYDYPTYNEDCHRPSMSATRYRPETQSLQMLQGILLGIISDGIVNEKEFFSLVDWLGNNLHLAGNYPFDKVYAAIAHVLEDGIVEQWELDELQLLFQKLINPVESCSAAPDTCAPIELSGKSIVLTGDFACSSKQQLEMRLTELGACCKGTVSRKTDYVVVGELGSAAWKFGSYGGKVKKAQEFIAGGANILIFKEKDFLSGLEAIGICVTR